MILISADLLTNHMVNFGIDQEFPWTLPNWVAYDLRIRSVINTSCLDEDFCLLHDCLRGTVVTNMCIDICTYKSSQAIRISNRKFSVISLVMYNEQKNSVMHTARHYHSCCEP